MAVAHGNRLVALAADIAAAGTAADTAAVDVVAGHIHLGTPDTSVPSSCYSSPGRSSGRNAAANAEIAGSEVGCKAP